ncbi:MAG: pyridoxal phosphate-dependent aminotransferase family protein [Porphyromonas sp.]|nr:pyridoxal phosphate-dependent aminotransferase family protein [Porphyromonas sp.]
MQLLQKKLRKFDADKKAIEAGIYPYFRTIQSEQGNEVIINGKKVLMFGSNSYLGLTNHPKVKEAAEQATKKYGTGCAGSRFLNGTLDIHIELEEELADFLGKEAVQLYSTGFQANVGAVSCLTGREDYILWDERDHASIIEGHRLSFSTKLKFRHNDMDSLEQMLQKCEPDRVKLIVVDGVFSMEGDLAPLPEITQLAKKYNAAVMVDEAHGIGVMGDMGRGTCDHFGVSEDVDLIMGTFSKSFASLGGFIAGDQDTVNYLKHHARSYIFSASCTPAATAAARAALEIMKTEPYYIDNLWRLTHKALKGFKERKFEIGATSTPIVPLFVRDNNKTFIITKELFERGLFVNPVVAPAVASGDTLIRFSLMASHTDEQLEFAMDQLQKVFIKYGVIEK